MFEQRLWEMGLWLQVNGEAIYETKPWIYQNDTINGNVWYTSKLRKQDKTNKSILWNPQNAQNTIVYAHLLVWPEDDKLILGGPNVTADTQVNMLGYSGKIKFAPGQSGSGIEIDLSDIRWHKLPPTITTFAWVFKLENLGEDLEQNQIMETFFGE